MTAMLNGFVWATYLRAVALPIAFFVLLPTSFAQTITGTTSIDIDPDTGNVTVVCETDLDGDASAYYDASVTCKVYGNGNFIGSKTTSKTQGYTGSASASFIFAGVPGTTYTATGTHTGIIQLSDDFGYLDYYYFGYWQQNFGTYPGTWDWFGSGPTVDRPTAPISVGDTTVTLTYQNCPTSVAIDQIWGQPLQNDYPAFSTGVGILSRMIVGPASSDFTSVVLYETVTPTGNSCPASIKSATDFPTITYNSPFVIGQPAGWENTNYPAAYNAFYDAHTMKSTSNILDGTSVTSCQSQATQVYTCNGRAVGTFSLTNTFYSGFISSQPVTFVSVSKQ